MGYSVYESRTFGSNPFMGYPEHEQFIELVKQSRDTEAADVLASLPADHGVRRYLTGELTIQDIDNCEEFDPILDLMNRIGSTGLAELFGRALLDSDEISDVFDLGIGGLLGRMEYAGVLNE